MAADWFECISIKMQMYKYTYTQLSGTIAQLTIFLSKEGSHGTAIPTYSPTFIM